MLKFNFYHNRKDNFYSNKVERETTGLIGYIRGDFGSGGNSFHHSWFENKAKLNNEVFKEDLNKVMEFLRERMLTDRMYMRSVVYGNPNAKIDSKESTSYGVFVETDGYEYDIRAICIQCLMSRWIKQLPKQKQKLKATCKHEWKMSL